MKLIIRIIFSAALFLAVGCISWDEGWKEKLPPSGTGDVKALFEAAASLEKEADTAEKVKGVLAAYEKIIAVEPANYDALSKAGEFAYLYSYMYATDKKVKEEYYLKAIKYCERAMYTNPEFKKLADKGKPVWECADTLTEREMDAMFYWYVGAGQYWTECFNSFIHLINFSYPKRCNIILTRMTAINPDWKYGRVHMSWGAFYAILPGFLGGDMKKSEEEFTKAVQFGPDYLNNYYVRARYLYVKKGDREGFRKDLEHILSADLKKINFEYAWGAAYKVKAKELLGQTDKLF